MNSSLWYLANYLSVIILSKQVFVDFYIDNKFNCFERDTT
ncbi:hypothetical protein VIBNIFTn2_1110012 [Vibrio nigripulchritudo FTn2]|nr:hypothetical protein VIBNIFTn2_1110012 [Vibrio nigripulchritudo FTn2]